MKESLHSLLHETYRELRPRAPIPEFELQFYPFVNLNNTIRLAEGRMKLRLSDLLESAPEPVLKAIIHILLSKIYRKPIDAAQASRYRRYITSRDMMERAHRVRQLRGRKRLESAQGRYYDLDEVFDTLNVRFFHGLLGRPQMSWSGEQARHLLGHYDPAHNAIIISKVFDHARVPRLAMEYIVYHEMLHLKHPVRMRGTRRCVHGKEFREDEKAFPQIEEARLFLKTL
ncbi:MAG: SprT-like domain-containing protein [Candidatus Korobacteraceae bacterium]